MTTATAARVSAQAAPSLPRLMELAHTQDRLPRIACPRTGGIRTGRVRTGGIRTGGIRTLRAWTIGAGLVTCRPARRDQRHGHRRAERDQQEQPGEPVRGQADVACGRQVGQAAVAGAQHMVQSQRCAAPGNRARARHHQACRSRRGPR